MNIRSLKFSTLMLGAIALASTAFGQMPPAPRSDIEFYARPSLVIAFPGDFDTAAGGAIAFGTTIHQMHSVEVEVTRFQSRDDYLKVTFTPILATYRFQVKPNQFAFHVGVSAGVTQEHGEMWWYSHNDTAFTYGIRAGASYDLTQAIALDADVSTLRLEKTDITTSGNIALVQLGVRFRF